MEFFIYLVHAKKKNIVLIHITTHLDELKNICQIQHTRHRSTENWVVNLLSGLIAYSFFPKKPSIDQKNGGVLVEI